MKQTMACGGCGNDLHRVYSNRELGTGGPDAYESLILECTNCGSQTYLAASRRPLIQLDWVTENQKGILAPMPHTK